MAINTGDTAWVLISTALVFLMTPGLGFFYGGLVRRKNLANTIIACFVATVVVGVQWVVIGYSLAFASSFNGLVGNLDWLALNGVGLEPSSHAPSIPHLAFMIFQGMFAVITPALIFGALVERIRFKTFILFLLLWSTLVYSPVAHWVWGGGWLASLGALDFAGGTVVHVNAGFAALAAALMLGRRIGYGNSSMEPSNVTYVILGAGLLWFGWFGFNAGSALAANELAANALVTTNTAAAAAGFTWIVLSVLHRGKYSIIGVASGVVAGLVAITPASGFVDPKGALAIGALAGVLCYYAVMLRAKLRVDDSLDVWGIHGVGGMWGAVATGIFANPAINGVAGLLFGNPNQITPQIIATIATAVYSFAVTLVILKILDVTVGLRVSKQEEMIGLDLTQHAEPAY